mmetsp:Transcript_21968/g.74689  ORF Transcript_21968/g.74689 Transcript_21968/m.74689 type:complete len:228 (+) Transcript_21968:1008-1691(+)
MNPPVKLSRSSACTARVSERAGRTRDLRSIAVRGAQPSAAPAAHFCPVSSLGPGTSPPPALASPIPGPSHDHVLRHLPDLQYVVLRDRGDDEVVVGVPSEVRYLARVPAVYEEELRWPVLGVLRVLLVPDPREVPHHEAPVRPAAAQHSLVLRGPADLEHLLGVVLEGVQPLGEVAHVEQGHRLVRGARGEDELVERVERDAVHLGAVGVHGVQRRLRGRLAGVPQQ